LYLYFNYVRQIFWRRFSSILKTFPHGGPLPLIAHVLFCFSQIPLKYINEEEQNLQMFWCLPVRSKKRCHSTMRRDIENLNVYISDNLVILCQIWGVQQIHDGDRRIKNGECKIRDILSYLADRPNSLYLGNKARQSNRYYWTLIWNRMSATWPLMTLSDLSRSHQLLRVIFHQKWRCWSLIQRDVASGRIIA